MGLHLKFINYAHFTFLQVTYKMSAAFEVLIREFRGACTYFFCRIPTNGTDVFQGSLHCFLCGTF